MRIVLLNFLSLDGVYQGPGSPDEDRTDAFERGGWLVPFVDGAFERAIEQWAGTATGFLFGRRTYQAFGEVWPTITDPSDINAKRLNSLPKYVAASSPIDTNWGPAQLLTGNVEAGVAELKQSGEGELQIHGSGRLGRSLVAANLVDELRLAIAPVIVGEGRKLFAETPAARGFSLAEQTHTPAGILLARFVQNGEAAVGTYIRGETNVGLGG